MTKQQIIGTREERLTRISGSEFSTILDINPYSKRIELCLEKAGVIVNIFEGNAATRRGERLEDKVIELFEQDSGLKVTNQQKEFRKKATKNCLALVCHVDGITDDDSVFEAKTTDYKAKTWQNGIPDYYAAQLEFNCYLSKKKQAYIAVVFCKEDEIIDFKWFLYVPQKSEDEILNACVEFTKDIEKYKEIGVINNGQIIESDFDDSLIEELNSLNETISKIKSQAKIYEDKKKIIEDKIKKAIGINAGIQTELFKVTMLNRISSPALDYKISRSGIKIEIKEKQNETV